VGDPCTVELADLHNFTAGWEKIFSPEPRLGFLAQSKALQSAIATGKIGAAKIASTQTQIFNNQLDAAVCAIFMILVTITVLDSFRIWWGLLRGTRSRISGETPFVISRLEAEQI
jgi:carbon starvation protein